MQPCTRDSSRGWRPSAPTRSSDDVTLPTSSPARARSRRDGPGPRCRVPPAAAAVFAAADAALGEPISAPRLGRPGRAARPDRECPARDPRHLDRDPRRAARALGRRRPDRAACRRSSPGHSMGQYSALVAAGALSLEDGVRLVRERGRLMQASGQGRDGAMAALIGLDDDRLPELVAGASAHGVFVVANRNAPGQVVVSGERAGHRGRRRARQGPRRQARDRAAGLGRGPLAADGRGGRGHARARSPTSSSTTRRSPLLANADARPIDDGRGLPDRARRAPDRRRRLGPRRRAHGRRRRRRPSSRSGRAAC